MPPAIRPAGGLDASQDDADGDDREQRARRQPDRVAERDRDRAATAPSVATIGATIETLPIVEAVYVEHRPAA